MFVEELRPLKRPKLGFPDFYPQDKFQKEDELTIQHVNCGLRQQPPFTDETGSAQQEVQFIRGSDITSRINQIVEAKRRTAWGQDSQKKKNNLSRDNFWPVPVGRNKKEHASLWFQELAGTEPLDLLINKKKIPIFNKREEIFDVLFEKQVPVFRAVWYIKMTAAYQSLGAESKLAKKKQLTDPSFEWTVSLTKFMQECAWRISNETPFSRHDSMSGQPSQNSTTESVTELSRWNYMTTLSSWLYQENLLDRQEFLRWLVERIETSKPSDDRSLVLYLPMALKYLKDISECVYLARPLVSFCCQKFSLLSDMQQKVQQIQLHSKKGSTKDSKLKDHSTSGPELMETNEDDDVFSSTGIGATLKTGVSARKTTDAEKESSKTEDTGRTGLAGRKRSKSGSLTVTIESTSGNQGDTPGNDDPNKTDSKTNDKSCKHHSSILLQLSCIIQIMAVQCPTAYIHVSLTGKGSSRDASPKASTPLDKLPYRLSEMPLPKKGIFSAGRKIESSLVTAENEIRKRTKAAESGWLAVTVSNIQTSNKGAIVQQVLSALQQLDTHSFTTCKYHSPLSTLFVKILQAQKNELTFQSSEAICMLLCQWAITPHRHGNHRPLVAARILNQIQSHLQHGKSGSHLYDLDALDEAWEQTDSHSSNDTVSFPFQQTLFQFLNTRAPLPVSLYSPLKSTEPFLLLLILFSELIYLGVFSYPLYLSTLVARGEAKSPIVPLLPFFRGEEEAPPDSPMESEPEELHLTISLSALRNITFGSPQKKLKLPDIHVKQEEEEGTISPVLQDRFGSQDNLMESLNTFTRESFVPEEGMANIKVEENSSLLEMRAHKLASLAMPDLMEESSSQLVSPVGFGSHPSSPIKQEIFNFSPNFSPPSLDESNIPPASMKKKKLNKYDSRHLLFAAYFPVNPSEISKQERVAVLCGTGHSRIGVETLILELSCKAQTILMEIYNENSPVLSPTVLDYLKQFRMLPNFNQNEIASHCAGTLLTRLYAVDSNWSYPSCSQFVFVCTLLETAGSFRQMIELLVELISFTGEKKEDKRRLPPILCFPVVNILWQYYPILLLSITDTSVVYEGLQRVLEGSQKPPKLSASQRAVFMFLQHLQTNCLYIKRTYHALPSFYIDYCVPATVDMLWQTNIVPDLLGYCQMDSLFAAGKFVESEQHIPQLIGVLQTSPKNSFFFVCEVFMLAARKQTNLHSLTVLAHICAEVCCSIDRVARELLGALRSLCIPSTCSTYKGCMTGFTQLTSRTDILSDRGIHGNVITMVGLLLSFNCFTVHDIITYIVKPIFKVYLLYPQGSGNAQNGSISLEFVSLLLRHLLVDEYIRGEHVKEKENCDIVYPPFVRQFLLTKSQQLSFDTVLALLKDLLKLCKDTLRSSHGTTFSSKTGMSILVKSFPSGSEGNEAALFKLRETLELIACQSWVREQCSQQGSRQLLEVERLGDASLSPPQAQYLLHLLIPYSTEDSGGNVTASDGSLPPHMTDPLLAMERILRNLDQWTLRNALLHLDIIINQAANHTHSSAQIDHLAHCVIQVFEDSCGDEWLGQTIESPDDEAADGAHSPSIWLVTPLVSKLPKAILGRVLKNAGNVLGRGQWWNLEKSQEKKRSTRATNAISPAKTSLQWQQPFLELILSCMNSHHSNHEELLVPLQKQLHTFLTAFEKEGIPSDEHSKAMLYAALKLRLSLVGSMLVSVCSSEAIVLEWVPHLVQLICCGAVDRQPDNSELFTNCLDMLNALLQALTPDFHMCMVSGGEDGKKTHITCIKKMKADLAASRSTCKQEIQQLFPLPQKAYEVTIVKPPSFTQHIRSNEKVQGLRIQETKEISPWEIMEGVRHTGPLQLSWFGAMRMKRKPLKFVEQRRLVRFHTHHRDMEYMTAGPYFVCLPQPPTTSPTAIPPDNGSTGNGGMSVTDERNISQREGIEDSQKEQRLNSQSASASALPRRHTQILDTIRDMNNIQTSSRIRPPGPIPPILQTLGTSHPALRPQRMVQPNHPHHMNPSFRPQNWFETISHNLSPDQRNQLQMMTAEERRAAILNLKRRADYNRAAMMQQQEMNMHPMIGGGYRPPMVSHQLSRAMHVNPPMQMNQVMQSQPPRHMMNMYHQPMPGQMPPPSHHPPQGPYMVTGPPPAMYRQHAPMYGPGGIPRQQHMPFTR